jgi:hypothetical protein
MSLHSKSPCALYAKVSKALEDERKSLKNHQGPIFQNEMTISHILPMTVTKLGEVNYKMFR